MTREELEAEGRKGYATRQFCPYKSGFRQQYWVAGWKAAAAEEDRRRQKAELERQWNKPLRHAG